MINKTISQGQYLKALCAFIKSKYSSSLAFGMHHGYSASYVNKMRTGERPPTQAVLDEMGYKLIPPEPQPVRYRKL